MLVLLLALLTSPARSQETKSTPKNPVEKIVLPEFPGGIPGLQNFLIANVKYPDASLRQGVYGSVFVTFIVDSVGQVTDAKVLKSPAQDLSQEALRVVALMPHWKPGTVDGKPERIAYNLPFAFQIRGMGANPKNVRFFEVEGVSFNYLKNWEVNSYATENGTEIKLERKGFGNTGTVFINYQNDTTNALNRLQETTAKIAKNSESSIPITFKAPNRTVYQFYKTWKADGQMQLNPTAQNLIGTMRLEVYTFNSPERSFTLKVLQTDDDRSENQALLDLLERSLNLEETRKAY